MDSADSIDIRHVALCPIPCYMGRTSLWILRNNGSLWNRSEICCEHTTAYFLLMVMYVHMTVSLS